jgi:hypothetical protein
MSKKAIYLILLLTIILFLGLLTSCFTEPKIVEVTRIVEVTPVAALQKIVEVTRLIEVTRVPEIPVQVVTRVVVEEVEVEVTRVVTEEIVVEVEVEKLEDSELSEELQPTSSDENEGKIYILTHIGQLYRMNLDGSNWEIIRNDVSLSSEFITLNPMTNEAYITQWDQNGQIKRVNLIDTGEPVDLYDGESSGGQGIALDTIAEKIYWGLYYNGVYVSNMDGTGRWEKLVDASELAPGQGQRGQLQIDSLNQQVYFRSAHNGPCGTCLGRKIWRVDFDGNNLVWIYQTQDGDALAIDPTGNKMYFSEGSTDGSQPHKIMRTNLDGSNEEMLFLIPRPFYYCRTIALDIPNHKMYLGVYDLEQNNVAIMRANLDGSDLETLYSWEEDVHITIALDLIPN